MEAKSNSKQREDTEGSYGDDVTSGSGDDSPSPALTTPSDVITCVFSQLDLVDLLNCSLVCKQWCIDSVELREGWKQTARAGVVDKLKKFQNYFWQARGSRPDLRVFISMQAISPKEDHIGSVLGVEVGDSFQYLVELNLLGLHKNLQGEVSCKKLGDGPEMPNIATSVVVMEQIDNMNPNYDVLICAREEEKKDEETLAEEDQSTPKHSGNRALVRSMQEKFKVRVLYGHAVQTRDGKKAFIFTYCGLYYVTGYEKVDLTEQKERWIRYLFKLERINRDKAVVPRMVCEIAGGSCSKS